MNRKVFVVLETLLLVIFITATIILAQRLKFDPEKGFISTAGIKVDGVKRAKMQVGDIVKNDTPATVDYLTEKEYKVKITKDGRLEWNNTISVTAPLLTTVYPVLFPTSMPKELRVTDVQNIYPVQGYDRFFYTKVGTDKNVELHRFILNQNIFGENVEDKKIADLGIVENPANLIINPSPTGGRLLLVRNGIKYILTGDVLNILDKPVIIDADPSQISWTLSERFLVITLTDGIFTYDISGQQRYTIAQNAANIAYKFMDTDANKILVLKSEKPTIPTGVPTVTSQTQNTKYSLLESNLDGKNSNAFSLNEDVLMGLNKAYLFNSQQGLILEYDNEVKLIKVDDRNPTTLNGNSVIFVNKEDQILLTRSSNHIYTYDYKEDKNYSMSIEDNKSISNVVPYFKSSNLIYTETASDKSQNVFSNYALGNDEVKLDDGIDVPLIALKKSEFVRLFYAKQNDSKTFDIYGISFEN